MRNYINEFGKEVALDGEWEMNFSSAQKLIKELKFSFVRKNSRKVCRICARADFHAPYPVFWKFYIQCWVDGKLVRNYRIKDDVYKTFTEGKKKDLLSPGHEYCQMFEFIPNEKETKPKQIVEKARVARVKKKKKGPYLIDILFEDEEEKPPIIEEEVAVEEEERPEQLLINILANYL